MLTGNVCFLAANGKLGFVVNIHSFSFGHSVLLSATHHHGESSLDVLVGLPSQEVSWMGPAGGLPGGFGALCVSLCWPHSFLRRGALLPYTANGAHRSLGCSCLR